MGWERLVNIVGVIPIPGVSGSNARHGVHAMDSLIDEGDEVARFIGAVERTCSFDAETPVTTDAGTVPIREIDVGDRVLAWNEALGQTSYYTVTDAYTDVHEVLVYLTIAGEEVTTTPEHPFLMANGEWTPAGELTLGQTLRRADGSVGRVQAITFVATSQVMYNMTVADAHTYTVGDAAGRLTAQQLPSLQWLTFDYDDAGNLIKQINAQGVQTDFVYDPHNRLQAQVVDPGGRAVRSEFAYDLADNLTQAVADVGAGRLNLTTHYTYTPFSPGGDYLLQQVIDPEGHATQFTYTPAGDLRTATDALGQTTTYTYTVQGWLTQMRTPQGRVATTLYTNDGQPDWVSDPRGSVTDYVYDAQGRLKTVMAGTVALGTAPALNQTITYTYDINDRVRIVTDGRNQAHTLSYDAFGRLEWEQDPLGNRLTYSYDKLDRLEEQVIGSNNPLQAVTTRYSYDAVGRRTTMRLDPDGLNLTTVYSYTQPGSSDTWNLQQVRDPKGQVTKYSYNSLGLRAATTDALNHTWTFAYDNLGRLDYQTDPLGHLVDYVVDGLGRTAELHQDGRVEKWAFRPDGALANYTDFAGRVTTFAYDNDQLLTGIDYPAPMADVGYGYDAAGNVTSVSDGLGSTTYSYDVLNRLDTRTRGSRVIDYGYSATNQVTSIDYWGQGTVGYGYDNAGRLDTLTPWGGAATTYSYRSSGLLAGISRPNSVATTYSYDTASRLTGLNHVQGGSNSLNNIVYGLDANGNRDWMTDLDGLTDYVYDALNRLDAVTYPAIPGGPPAATIDYSMDEVGNRTGDGTTTYGHDASDRITNSGFVYDTNGNLLSDGVKSYEYDAANRLTKVISGSVTIDYAYDGWGNLIQESSNGITTEYVLDERGALPTILGEVRSDGTERLYAYGPEGFAAQKTVGGAVEYPLLDGLGSVRHLTDGSGTVTLSRSYDAFGNLRHSTGTGAAHLGYTGELQDQPTGLVYLRARFYHPVLGRFLQRDSFGGFQSRPQSLHRYAYTENNPVNLTDPSGHIANWLIGAGIGFGLGSTLYLINEQSQDGIDLSIDISWDGWIPTCANFNDWGDLLTAAATGGVAGALIATPGFGSIGASMAGNLLSDHFSNAMKNKDFSGKRHTWNGAAGALIGFLTGVIGQGMKGSHLLTTAIAKGSVGAVYDTVLDYNSFFGIDTITAEMLMTNFTFNVGGEIFGGIMGDVGEFASRDLWNKVQLQIWDAFVTQSWKYLEGPAKYLLD